MCLEVDKYNAYILWCISMDTIALLLYMTVVLLFITVNHHFNLLNSNHSKATTMRSLTTHIQFLSTTRVHYLLSRDSFKMVFLCDGC